MTEPHRMIQELRHRRVPRTAAIYAVSAAGVWGAADIAVDALGLPPMVLTGIVIASIAGFPLALILSWFLRLSQERESDPPQSLVLRTGDAEGVSEGGAGKAGTSKWRWAGIGVVGLLATWGVFSVGWLLVNRTQEKKLETVVASLESLAGQSLYESAYEMAVERLPDDSSQPEVWDQFSVRVDSIGSEPPGASVFRQPYGAEGASWHPLGVTPLQGIRVPMGMSIYRFDLEGHERIEMATEIPSGGGLTVPLPEIGVTPAGMVFVPEGTASIPNYAEATMHLGPFLIDRYEVTNQDFRAFVEAGGYTDPLYWDSLFVLDGTGISWEEAMGRFVDKTNRPGPATWEAGDFPNGAEEFPVQGVSWFEARAYARFVEKDLPTAFHWHRAAQVNRASFVVPISNFGSGAPAPVGEYRGMTGWGTYDMAGNVREWVLNASGAERFILGGAWNDFTYLFPVVYATSPWNRSEKNGFRLTRYLQESDLAEAGRHLDLSYRDYRVERPVSDEAFEAFKTNYAYDPEPIDAILTVADTTDDWIVQEWSFDAAYEEDRVLANLYLPREGSPPYQAVVYMPGSGAVTTGSRLADFRENFPLDFILKTGRAVIFPAYDGAYNRQDPTLTTSRASPTHRHAEFTAHWVKDLRRSIDFLESVPEIDAERIAYLGSSWGGRLGAIMLSMEPRLKTGVLYLGGFRPEQALPVADDLNFVPRVTQPVVMINGRDDHLRPYEASQLPFFELLGTEAGQKEHKVFPGGHFVPQADMIRETLDWLDRYLGPVG